MLYSLEAVLSVNSFDSVAEIWSKISGMEESMSESVLKDAFTEKEIKFKNLDSFIHSIDDNSLYLEVGLGEVIYNNGAKRGARSGRLIINNLATSESLAESWISQLLLDDRFVQARLYDYEYDFLQNSTSLLPFQERGLSTENIVMISNGLPFPLERQVVDTSKNPGRSISKLDYREIVGSVMWLGENFWTVSGKDKDSFISGSRLDIEDKGPYIKVRAYKSLFNCATGEQRDIQNKLRLAIYG